MRPYNKHKLDFRNGQFLLKDEQVIEVPSMLAPSIPILQRAPPPLAPIPCPAPTPTVPSHEVASHTTSSIPVAASSIPISVPMADLEQNCQGQSSRQASGNVHPMVTRNKSATLQPRCFNVEIESRSEGSTSSS
ncbi:hypothetical protein PIB30_044961 [Stylosanthes scabra]|uniref:Uncharacterized protein n=1 Tax=Stylosanthes scabra TaxID=79078 RepID=A0ABU6TGD4_9FABA|nr:hypothetical protein [Stylosanthes scabra]